MEPFDRAWFDCYPSGRIPSDYYGIPTCSSNDFTRSVVGLTQAASRWKQMRTLAPKWRECLPFKITWAQISSQDARVIFSFPAGGVVWPLLPDRDTFGRCFDQIAASKSTTRQKGRTLIRVSKLCSSANHVLNTWYNVSSKRKRPISLNVFQMLNGPRKCFRRCPF